MRLLQTLLAGVLLFAAGCDTPPGPHPPMSRAPVVSAFQFDPAEVNLADVDPEDIQHGVVIIRLNLQAEVDAMDDEIEAVRYLVRSPDRSTSTLVDGDLSFDGTGRYAASVELSLQPGAVGNYPVVVYAVNSQGRLSNQVSGMLRYRAPSEPPVIEEIVAPDVIQRPSDGMLPVEIVAVVSDPDGLENIERVVLWNVNTPGSLIQMHDDGSSASGDDEAGDGRYTVTLSISSTNEPGVNTFAFQARDLTGLESEIIEHSITIQ